MVNNDKVQRRMEQKCLDSVPVFNVSAQGRNETSRFRNESVFVRSLNINEEAAS